MDWRGEAQRSFIYPYFSYVGLTIEILAPSLNRMLCTEPVVTVGLNSDPHTLLRPLGLSDTWWTSQRPDRPEHCPSFPNTALISSDNIAANSSSNWHPSYASAAKFHSSHKASRLGAGSINGLEFRMIQLQRMEAIGLHPDSWPHALREHER